MATSFDLSNTRKKEEQIFGEVKHHNEIGFQETDRRATGKNRIGSISFDEADELFRSWIDENKWPYDALLFDPRVFTFIFEKTSRLISNKPQGRLIPREGSDVLSAKINNELLSYQWDQANFGGSMLTKWSLMDINARKYGAAFALCKWRYEKDDNGTVVFDGPEMQVLNNRDVAHDLTATAIENCKWFQVRQYLTPYDLKNVSDSRGKTIYKNLDKLEVAIGKDNKNSNGGGGDSRSTNWTSRNRAISQLELDPVGKDDVFKTVEIVTEYRRDRWITFAPKYGVVIRDIANPYKHYELPITMLKYYQIDDDLYGLSEIEPVKGLQKAINAILCQYVDEINQKLYSPIAIGPGVRQHTLGWGKGARWIMNNPLSDFRLVESKSNAAQYFQTTYSALVSAMQNALGESSLGTSNIQPFQKDKTATEVKALQIQRNARDNYNQIFLAEAIKRQMMLWYAMNQLLLFSDPTKAAYAIRLSGVDALRFFEQRGLADNVIDDNAFEEIGKEKVASAANGEDFELDANYEMPKYPVNVGTKDEPKMVNKLTYEDGNKSAQLYIEPQDLKGTFDFVIDVQSMTSNADDQRREARQAAVTLLSSNPNVVQMLAAEDTKPKFKELFINWLEDLGFSDADRFFESIKATGGQAGQGADAIMAAIQGLQGKAGAPKTPNGVAPEQAPAEDQGNLSPDALAAAMGGAQ